MYLQTEKSHDEIILANILSYDQGTIRTSEHILMYGTGVIYYGMTYDLLHQLNQGLCHPVHPSMLLWLG